MDPRERFAVDSDEPLGLWVGAPESAVPAPGLCERSFEYSSRGDRVPGRLLLPAFADRKGALPLVMLQHGARGSKDADYIDAVAGRWVLDGAAVACIDFPLHGERRNSKFLASLLRGFGLEGKPDAAGRELVADFVQQAVVDLRRGLDALATVDGIDAERVAFAGLSLGSIVGATFCAVDPRPRAVALALGGGGFGTEASDPARHVAGISPRPLLMVNASRDETVSRPATEALYAAAGEPKEIQWFDCGHRDLPGRALKAMWAFLSGHLGVDPSSG